MTALQQQMTPLQAMEYAHQLEADNNLSGAEKTYREILAAQPSYHPAYHALGLLAYRVNKFSIAADLIGSALALDETVELYHRDRGEIQRLLGHVEEAIAEGHRAVELQADDPEAHYNLGVALADAEHYSQAVIQYRKAVKLKPEHGMAWNNMGTALEKQENRETAEKCYRRAVKINPDHIEAQSNLGKVLSELGKLDEARDCLGRVLAVKPDMVSALHSLSTLKKFSADDPQLATMESMLPRAQALDPTDRIRLLFAIGKARGDCGQHDKAFEAFRLGNRLKRLEVPSDEARAIEQTEQVLKYFDAELFSRHTDVGNTDTSPVFIVGMPRSGTTLTEQILCSHPQVYGAGELKDFNAAALAIGESSAGQSFSASFSKMSAADFSLVGKHYIKAIRKLSHDAAFVTDKMPANFFYIGLIHLALPNAKIIHTLRDPMDVCLSNYIRLFNDTMDFTYELETLGRYYNRYIQLMEHWDKVLPSKVLHIRYEDTINDQEGQTRKLLDYLGLPWDDRCMDFHQNQRRVRTASIAQVRQPIYKSSIGNWKHYEQQLQPLMDIISKSRSTYYQ